jgi:hypothetical protein
MLRLSIITNLKHAEGRSQVLNRGFVAFIRPFPSGGTKKNFKRSYLESTALQDCHFLRIYG